MRVLIVDDEPAARRRLAGMLGELGEELAVEVVGEAGDGLEALRLTAELAPDLLLLDISMPEVDGFDVVRHLPAPRPLVVFQTAHDEHALEAFDHEAVDYVVKPVSRERLRRALERASWRAAAGPSPQTLDRLRAALVPAPRRRRLLVRSGRGHRLVPLAEIRRFSARDGAVYADTGERPHLTDYTLAELEQRAGDLFLRVNRSELVNLEAIEGIVGDSDGSATLRLAGDVRLRVSRRRAAVVRAALEG